MTETSSPSKEYRDKLAHELVQLRNSGQKDKAASVLSREKQTHTYVLADAITHHSQENTPFIKRAFDSEKDRSEYTHNTVSNEASLYETFPYIKDVKGAGVGVGFDQMLDITVNTNLEETYIVDILPKVATATRAMLEVGRKHHKLFGRYPKTSEYIAYFEEKNVPLTLEMLKTEFTTQELKELSESLTKKVAEGNEKPATDAPLQVEHYLKFKNKQKDYRSWVSDDAALEKIISMYEAGKIVSVLGDMTGQKSMPGIAENLKRRKMPLSLVYLSNAPYYFAREQKTGAYESNLNAMPVSEKTIIIETRMGIMPIPKSVSEDKWMSKIMRVEWTYEVQSLKDALEQKSGIYKVDDDGRMYTLKSLTDRYAAVDENYASEQEMGIQVPKKGLVIAI